MTNISWKETRKRLVALGAKDVPDEFVVGMDLSATNLLGAKLSRADLRGVCLRNAELSDSNLSGADLKCADLRGADMDSADLRGADLRGASMRGANLAAANLSWANLSGADLREADLPWANLRYANMTRVYMAGASLTGADFRGASLDFSAWPLWCGSLGALIDEDQARQLAYHLAAVLPETVDGSWADGLREFANRWSGVVRHALPHVSRAAGAEDDGPQEPGAEEVAQ